LRARDQPVNQGCIERSLPLVIDMAGAYEPNIEQIVDIHETTILLTSELTFVQKDAS